MKKILMVCEAMGGGVFTYLVDLVNALADSYEIHIAYGIRPQTPTNYAEYFDKRINLIEVKNFTRSVSSTKDVKAFFEIKEIAKRIQPDIIHLHSSKAGALGRWAFNGDKTPLFYTPHGYSFLMKNYGTVRRSIYKAIEVICAKRNCTTISCSEGEHRETLELTRKAVYVDNGINVSDLKKTIESIMNIEDSHPFTVFTLGRICYQKNPELFNEIAKALPDVKFVWIGDGELKSRLSSENIEITGWLDRKDAITKALSADTFILTSLWEGLPISLLEAMYMKKPCIVSDVIGNHDVIHNDENGYVCTNIDEYVSAIRRIISGKCSSQVRNAYQDIMRKYNTTVMAKKYLDIYQNAFDRMFENIGERKYIIDREV